MQRILEPGRQMIENLRWVMASPGLIAEAAGPVVSDAECERFSARATSEWAGLLSNPAALERFLLEHHKSGRLGNLFESLLQFWLEELLAVREVAAGVAIRDGGATLGELDFVFRSSEAGVEHWEAAVKFFMCIAPTPELAVRANSFVGQALVDRLDRKLELSLKKQLPLARHPRAREILAGRGFAGPIRSRLFFKGRLFYPLAWDWRNVVPPPDVAPMHERGWWISWEGESSIRQLLDVDHRLEDSGGTDAVRSPRAWVVLGKERWMGRVSVPSGSLEILDDQQLRNRLHDHFQASTNAVQLARVEQLEDGSWREAAFSEGMGRGMVLTTGWPTNGLRRSN